MSSHTLYRSLWVGLGSFFLGMLFIFAGEYHVIQAQQTNTVFEVESDHVNSRYEGKRIITIGDLVIDDRVSDDLFAVEVSAIKLRRNVAMYQWEETIQPMWESEAMLALYEEAWLSYLVDSDTFRDTTRYENPKAFPYQSNVWSVGQLSVGAFSIDMSVLDSINDFVPYPFILDAPEGFVLYKWGLYSWDPAFPKIGDVRISFDVILPDTSVVLWKQSAQTIVADSDQIVIEPYANYDDLLLSESLYHKGSVWWLLRMLAVVVLVGGIVISTVWIYDRLR